MRNKSLLFACLVTCCLACVGHGQAVQFPAEAWQGSLVATDAEFGEPFDAGNFHDLRPLARLLLSPNLASAFNTCCLERQHASRSFEFARAPATILDGCRHLANDHPVMRVSDEVLAKQPASKARRDMLSKMAVTAAASALSGVLEHRPANAKNSIMQAPIAAEQSDGTPQIPNNVYDSIEVGKLGLGEDGTVNNPILSRKQIEKKMSKVPVFTIVNDEDSPYFTAASGNAKGGSLDTGYFWLDPAQALIEQKLLKSRFPDAKLKAVGMQEVYFSFVRANFSDINGYLRLRSSKEQLKTANDALGLFGQKVDGGKGDVPLFFNPKIQYETNDKTPLLPFFLAKEDLDSAWKLNFADEKKGEKGALPLGLIQVITLDELVDKMLSGYEGLEYATIVASSDFIFKSRELAKSGILTDR